MKKIIKKIIQYFAYLLIAAFSLAIGILIYSNIPVSKSNEAAKLGVTFSHRYASDLGLDWKRAYGAILDDLGVKYIRLPVYWDLVEKEENKYDFSDIDWQLKEASKRQAEVILVVGQKVPRWPECAIPERYIDDETVRKEKLLEFIRITIERYRDNREIKYWQVENEPFLAFGICPKSDSSLLDAEIELVKKNDSSREIIITDSGELSTWIPSARRADIFGTTMYRTIYNESVGYFKYPLGPRFFHFKYWLIKTFSAQEKAIVVELQAEPWISGWTAAAPLADQFQSMNAEKLKDNVAVARQAGFPIIYLWGVEWWYWLKIEKGHPELWETAKGLIGS